MIPIVCLRGYVRETSRGNKKTKKSRRGLYLLWTCGEGRILFLETSLTKVGFIYSELQSHNSN